MERIVKLMNFYRGTGNGAVSELVDKLKTVLRSGNNFQAEEEARKALILLVEVVIDRDHIVMLQSFIDDLENRTINIQPLL